MEKGSAPRHAARTTVITVLGPLAGVSIYPLRRALELALRGPSPQLLVDLSDSPYIDSAAIALLLLAFHRAQSRGQRLCIVGLPPQPRKVFELYGFDRILELSHAASHQPAAGPDGFPGQLSEGTERHPPLLPAGPVAASRTGTL